MTRYWRSSSATRAGEANGLRSFIIVVLSRVPDAALTAIGYGKWECTFRLEFSAGRSYGIHAK